MGARRWTNKEYDYLVKSADQLPLKEIADHLGRSYKATATKLRAARKGNLQSPEYEWVEATMCEIFSCEERGGYYCCCDCPKLATCENRCMNSPERCGLSYTKEVRRRKLTAPTPLKTGPGNRYPKYRKRRDPQMNENTIKQEELTPAQKECQTYEQAIEFYGKDNRLLNAVEKLTQLASTLISARNYKGEDVDMGDFYKQSINLARAEVNIALNQLDLMLDDYASEEATAFERLVAEIERVKK